MESCIHLGWVVYGGFGQKEHLNMDNGLDDRIPEEIDVGLLSMRFYMLSMRFYMVKCGGMCVWQYLVT